MPPQTDIPKVFISYSWNPPQHKEKVIAFAKRLRDDRVDVILDVWDLAPGQDKNVFMEQTVNNPEIKRVLLICNKDYQTKANSRQGGVGTESLIMSKEVYAQADQTKFIALVFESDESGHACVPTFLNSRIFFDLRDTEEYEANYEQLIRNIFDKPVHRKPPLGIRPAYLDEETPVALLTSHRVGALKRAFLDGRPHAPMLVKEYYTVFLQALAAFEPQDGEFARDNFIELVLSRIEQLRPLRDDFVDFLEVYLSMSPVIDIEGIHDFFEKLLTYLDAKAVNGYQADTIGSLRFDYLRFFVYELTLYFTAALVKAEKFEILAEIISDKFIVTRPQEAAIIYDFIQLSGYNATLNKYKNEKAQSNRISVVGDIIKERATGKYSFDELKQADLLLFYITELAGFTPNAYSHSFWRAETTGYYTYDLPVFAKIISTRYFERIKVLFGMQAKEELAEKVKAMEGDHYVQLWYRSDYMMQREVPRLSSVLNLDKIATVR